MDDRSTECAGGETEQDKDRRESENEQTRIAREPPEPLTGRRAGHDWRRKTLVATGNDCGACVCDIESRDD